MVTQHHGGIHGVGSIGGTAGTARCEYARRTRTRRGVRSSARPESLSSVSASPTTLATHATRQILKEALIASTSSLDRGLDASGIDVARDIEQTVMGLCAASPAPRLDLDETALDGTWKLQYSSEFVPGNTKFVGNWPFLASSEAVRRATKPFLPKILDVQQVIDVAGKRLDNVVTLELRPAVVGELPVLGAQLEKLGGVPVVVARLEHGYGVSGAATVTIRYERTTVNGEGGVNGWIGRLPELRIGGGEAGNVVLAAVREATAAYNSSSFDVVYVDETLRVTRADRGELRVFVRESRPVAVEMKD